ncbi:MAG TPA: sigma-54 dependent transcriptional regulator [Steroidobacteraceae bacterium]|nr:sigma-54 dependent transcriptional regulator [Steroidobacteraceae bacterium]HUO19919.1 sigma-54 dependent transcriptional regulator [Steroidobacteraceae bacterium]
MTASRILVVDDEADIRGLLKEILAEEGYEVEVAADATQARSSRAAQVPDLVLLDIWMPDTDGITLLREWSETDGYDCPVVMMSGHGTVDTAVEATRLGAFDFVEKPLSLTKLLRTVERALDAGRRRRLSERAQGSSLALPIGKSKLTQNLREQVQQAAASASPVLLIGELGSGREAYARHLHSLSVRASKPFHMVVAASLSADPAAALFGSERDGKVVQGALDLAAGGSLFLNGLEDLPSQAQRALAGAIEQNGYTRVGGRERLPLNVRWISSAQEGFEERAAPEPFRRDLIAHLNVITLRVPPLREYAEDVPDLLRYYVDRLVDDQHLPLRRFSIAAQNRLRNYPWPGNLGELRNLVQRVLVLGSGEEIRLDEVERELAVKTALDEPLVKQDLLALPLREAREQFERAYLQQQLLLCNGKVGQLAKRVGMERTHLYRKLRALGVDFRQLGED